MIIGLKAGPGSSIQENQLIASLFQYYTICPEVRSINELEWIREGFIYTDMLHEREVSTFLEQRQFLDIIYEILAIILNVSYAEIKIYDFTSPAMVFPSAWDHHRVYDENGEEVMRVIDPEHIPDLESSDDIIGLLEDRIRPNCSLKGYEFIQAFRNNKQLLENLHPNIWVNALLARYTPIPDNHTNYIKANEYDNDLESGQLNIARIIDYPSWIITDVHSECEINAIRNGVVNQKLHPLDDRFLIYTRANTLDKLPSETIELYDHVIDVACSFTEICNQIKAIISSDERLQKYLYTI